MSTLLSVVQTKINKYIERLRAHEGITLVHMIFHSMQDFVQSLNFASTISRGNLSKPQIEL